MVKKFLEYDIETLTCIKCCASFAQEVKGIELRLKHGYHLIEDGKWLQTWIPNKYDEMIFFPNSTSAVEWVLTDCGFYEIKEKLEKLMKEYGIKENAIVVA